MFKSAIINKESDPSLNVNLGCNLKHKPRDYQEEIFVTIEFLRSLSRRRLRQFKEIDVGKNCVSQWNANQLARSF